VVCACPRHEKHIAQQFEKRGIPFFLPLYKSMRRWKDRKKQIEMPLFPGYVFVQIAPQNKLRVLTLPGVVRLVTFNGQPTAVPEREIEELRSRLSLPIRIEPHPYLRAGCRVRVRGGPVQGLEGIVIRRRNCCRVVFSIDAIRRSLAVEVDEADLEVVSARFRKNEIPSGPIEDDGTAVLGYQHDQSDVTRQTRYSANCGR
jgi:transcription antitermination factor NusG